MASFSDKILEVVRKIPKGETLSYQEVARRAGRPKAYRAVGNILHKNHNPKIPCHRVIRADGKLGGYNCGLAKKRALLEKERQKNVKRDGKFLDKVLYAKTVT